MILFSANKQSAQVPATYRWLGSGSAVGVAAVMDQASLLLRKQLKGQGHLKLLGNMCIFKTLWGVVLLYRVQFRKLLQT